MKKYYFLPLAIAVILVTVSSQNASAHGHTSFEINERVYSFTIGSLNEPVAVDDKTGLDLHVISLTHQEHKQSEISGVEYAGTPVQGLDKTLKVELIAGDKKKTLDISPAFGVPGSYKANFVPTIQTTYSYRLFGTIDSVPFNYTFTCNPAGHPQSPEDKTEVKISEGVMRIEAAGAFGCPVAKADLGFPEISASIYDLNAKDAQLQTAAADAQSTANSSKLMAIAGIVLGAIGVGMSWIKGKKTV